MHFITVFWGLIPAFGCFSVSLLFSPSTPFDISRVESLLSTVVTAVLVTSPSQILPPAAEVVVDYLYDAGLSQVARETYRSVPYYEMWTERDRNSAYIEVFSDYLQALNWSNILLIGDTRHLPAVTSLYTLHSQLFTDTVIIPSDSDLNFTMQLVGREIKPQGFKFLALFLNPRNTVYFLQALEAKKLNKPGYAYILSQESGRYRYLLDGNQAGLMRDGLLVVSDEMDTEGSMEAAEARRIEDLLAHIPTPRRHPTWHLYFTHNMNLTLAASHPGSLSTPILFPGNTSSFPAFSKVIIPTSVNYRLVNPDGSVHPYSNSVQRGYQIAFEHVNNRTDVLSNFHFSDNSKSFTGIGFSYNYSFPKVKSSVSDLGLIYMAPPVGQAVLGMTSIFTDLNLSLPITAVTLLSSLSSASSYPLYICPRPSNTYISTVIARVIRFFGWSQVAFLYGVDGGDTQDEYEQFLSIKDEYGINITNPENLRALPPVINTQNAAQVNISLTAIVQSTTRVIIIAHTYIFVLEDMLYELGVREQYVQIYVGSYANSAFVGPENFKRRVVTKGGLILYPRLFVGSVGKWLKRELLSRDGNDYFPGTCFAYDAAYHYFYATEYLLTRGLDYEDPFEIVHSMRQTYFHGCSGFVTIENDTNTRFATEIIITNFQYNSQNDTYEFKDVGVYSPLSVQPYKITSPLQWPDDKPTYSDTKPGYKDCDFLEEQVREVGRGWVIGGVSLGVVCGYTVLVTVIVLCRKGRNSVDMLHTRVLISSEDVWIFGTMLCDGCQLTSLGPSLNPISHFLGYICRVLGMSWEVFFTPGLEIYWVLLELSFSLVFLMCLIALIWGMKWEAYICGDNILRIELLMMTLGYLQFVPILSSLFSVFLCFHGVSDTVTDTFLNSDCSLFCWRGGHLGYIAGSSLSLLVFIPVTIMTRFQWQQRHPCVNIKANFTAVTVKTVLQVVLVANTALLRERLRETHAYVHFALMLLYLIWTLFQRQFNYDRLNLWQFLVHLSLLFLSISSYISSLHPALSPYLLYSVLGAWAFFLLTGLIIQTCIPRFYSFLKRERSKDVRGLFVFAFTGGTRAQQGLRHFYQSNRMRRSNVVVTSEQDIRLDFSQ